MNTNRLEIMPRLAFRRYSSFIVVVFISLFLLAQGPTDPVIVKPVFEQENRDAGGAVPLLLIRHPKQVTLINAVKKEQHVGKALRNSVHIYSRAGKPHVLPQRTPCIFAVDPVVERDWAVSLGWYYTDNTRRQRRIVVNGDDKDTLARACDGMRASQHQRRPGIVLFKYTGRGLNQSRPFGWPDFTKYSTLQNKYRQPQIRDVTFS